MKKILVCPKCHENLICCDRTFKCVNNHSYDIAKQGYVNLVLGSSAIGGDDREMCRSRHEFHNRDYYRCLSEKLAEICLSLSVKSIVDAGCGEGYYLRRIRDKYLSEGVSFDSLCGIDLAKEACSIASKCEKNLDEFSKIQYAVAGIFDMPVAENSVDCVLSVFAPVPDKEALRVLCSGGILIVVSPGEKHLDGLKKAVYDIVYDNEPTQKVYPGFILQDREYVGDCITVEGRNIIDLFHMTPYYWKTSEKDAEKLADLSFLETRIEFVISVYKKI